MPVLFAARLLERHDLSLYDSPEAIQCPPRTIGAYHLVESLTDALRGVRQKMSVGVQCDPDVSVSHLPLKEFHVDLRVRNHHGRVSVPQVVKADPA